MIPPDQIISVRVSFKTSHLVENFLMRPYMRFIAVDAFYSNPLIKSERHATLNFKCFIFFKYIIIKTTCSSTE